MCCRTKSHHGSGHWGHPHGCSCGCDGHFHSGPHFWTKEEKIAWLGQYLEELQEGAKAIEERIAKLKEE